MVKIYLKLESAHNLVNIGLKLNLNQNLRDGPRIYIYVFLELETHIVAEHLQNRYQHSFEKAAKQLRYNFKTGFKRLGNGLKKLSTRIEF